MQGILLITFPGANLSDMEDFVKPLVTKMPDKLILHVGTNDIKSSLPKAIAESTFNLVTQIRQDSLETSVGVSALLVRSDNSVFAVKVNQLKSTLFLKASVLVTRSHFWEIQTLADLILTH